MILDEFAKSSGLKKRWEEHEKFLLQQQSQGIGGGVRSALATVGIGLEVPATLGKGTTGQIAASIGYAAPGMSEFTDRAYLANVAAGGNNKDTSFGQSIAAGVAANEGAAAVNPYITGIANMVLDPSNVIPTGPAGHLKDAKKLRLAEKLGAGASLSPEFIARGADVPVGHGIASPIEEALAKTALLFGDSGEKAAGNVAKSAAKAEKARVQNARPAVSAIEKAAKAFAVSGDEAVTNIAQSSLLADAGENLLLDVATPGKGALAEQLMPRLDQARKASGEAGGMRAVAKGVYRMEKDKQAEFVKAAVAGGQEAPVAKVWFQELADKEPDLIGLGKPQAGESYKKFVGPYDQAYYQLQSAEKNLYAKAKAAFDAPEISNLTQAQADAMAGPEALGIQQMSVSKSPRVQEQYKSLVAEADSNELSRLNERYNAMELRDTPVASADDYLASGREMPQALDGNTAPFIPVGSNDAMTLAPIGNKMAEGRARTLFEQLMHDLGPTDDAESFRRKFGVVNKFLQDKGYNLMDEDAKLIFANGPVIPPDEAARLMAAPAGAMSPAEAAAYGRGAGVDRKFASVATEAPDSPKAIKTTLTETVTSPPLPTSPEAAPFVSVGEDSTIGRMSEFVRALIISTTAAQKDSFTRKGVGVMGTLKAIPSVWSGIQTQTVRNLLMDPIWNRVLLQHEGLGQSTYQEAGKVIMRRLTVGEKNEARLFGGIADTGGIHEWPELMGDEAALDAINEAWKKNIGGSAWELESEGAMRLNAMEQLAASIPILLANPTRAVTNLALAPLGLLAESRQHAFHIINSITHTAARSAAFESAYVPFMENSAKRLLGAAAAEGLDVSTLAGRAMKSAGRDLGLEGGFGPREVAALLGERYANEWTSMIEQGRQAGFAETKRVFGDFYNRGPVEKAISKFVPFMSWTWRAYPRMMNMVGEHPLLAATLYQLYRADSQLAKKEQRKNYQYGTLAINKDTKVVGLLASLFSPEQEGELRFNPMSLISPVGGEQIGMAAGEGENPLSSDASWNEQAYRGITDVLNTVGSGVNPITQAAAYVTGSDYKSPGAASRYAAIDNLMSQFTPADAPTIQGPLRGLREKLTGDKDRYDPIETKAMELIFQRTGKPANHKDNRQLAAQLAAHTGIYEEAQRVLDTTGAGRAAFNANSPLTLMLNTNVGEDIRKTKKGLPYTYDDIQKAKAVGIPGLAQFMANANEEYKMKNPAAYASETPATIKSR